MNTIRHFIPHILLLFLLIQTSVSATTPFSSRLKLVLTNHLSLKPLQKTESHPQQSLQSSFKGLSIRQSEGNSSGALSGETCFQNSDCAGGSCVETGSIPCTSGSFTCICMIPSCNTDSDCLSGETCSLRENDRTCISKNSRLAEREGALTLGTCKRLSDCATGRDCFSLNEDNIFELCDSNNEFCVCLPFNIDTCDTIGSNAGCVDGEVCEKLSTSFDICVDPTFADVFEFGLEPTLEENPMPSEENPMPSEEDPMPSEEEILGMQGLTLDKCTDDIDCVIPRNCECVALFTECRCLPQQLDTCLDDADCVIDGEVCGKFLNIGICVSESVVRSLMATVAR